MQIAVPTESSLKMIWLLGQWSWVLRDSYILPDVGHCSGEQRKTKQNIPLIKECTSGKRERWRMKWSRLGRPLWQSRHPWALKFLFLSLKILNGSGICSSFFRLVGKQICDYTPLFWKFTLMFRFSKKFQSQFLKWYYLCHSFNNTPTLYYLLLLHSASVIQLNKPRIHAFMELHSGCRYLLWINNITYHAQYHKRTEYCYRKWWRGRGEMKWEHTLVKVREGLTEKVTFKLRLERQSGTQEEKCSRTRNSKGKGPVVEKFHMFEDSWLRRSMKEHGMSLFSECLIYARHHAKYISMHALMSSLPNLWS